MGLQVTKQSTHEKNVGGIAHSLAETIDIIH